MQGKERLQVRELAKRFPPGKRRYKRFGSYAKRLKVRLDEVGHIDLIIVWKAKGTSWECFALPPSLKAGLHEVLQTWKLGWDLELSHRLYKQNLGLGNCPCRRYSAQLKQADLVLDAFDVRTERARYRLSWRRAQAHTAARHKNALLTDTSPLAA